MRQVVVARAVGNRRLSTACHLWAFAALTGSPGARRYYDAHRARGASHHQALRAVANRLYDELAAEGVDVVYDDRDIGPGSKFADAELLGCPLRLTVGKRGIESGEVEVQIRRGQEKSAVALDGAA